MIAHSGPVSHLVMAGIAVAAVAAYLVAWSSSPRRSNRHAVAWACGVAAALVAVSPPLETFANRTFTWHMVQHLILIVLAAPLVAVARPFTIVRAGTSIHAPAGAAPWRRAWRRVGPFVAAGGFVTVLVATHLTGVYDLAIRRRFVHDLEHVAYLGSALVLWSTIAASGRTNAARRIGAVFAVIGGTALVAMILLSAPRPLVASYETRLGTSAAVDDQRRAAALMWVSGMATTLPLLVLAFWRWASAEHRATVRAESLADGSGRRSPGASARQSASG